MGSLGEVNTIYDVDLQEEDFLYEDELNRNPYNLRMWLRYVEKQRDFKSFKHYLIYERALQSLPGSYKLWYLYLDERCKAVRGLLVNDPAFEELNAIFDRALVYMHKMPRIWIMYLETLITQRKVSETRRVFNKSIQSLPIMQHQRVWKVILDYVIFQDLPTETGVRLYRRYLKYEPTHIEEYIAYLLKKELYTEAAELLVEAVNDDGFVSLEGKSKHQLWLDLCKLITDHPQDVQTLQVDQIILGGIRKFTDEVGVLWTSLADYYVRRGLFETARDKLMEGLKSVVTVRDFTLIFDHLITLEESMIGVELENQDEQEDENEELEELDDDFLLNDKGSDVDLRIFRLEMLLKERPLLLNSVRLRQNPHNVHEWQKRVKLYKDDVNKQILTYTEAVLSVNPEKAIGKPHQLWVDFAKLYDKHASIENARSVFQRAVQVQFKYTDDLAQLYCQWAEMELAQNNIDLEEKYQNARDVLQEGTRPPPQEQLRKFEISGEQLPIRIRVFKSVKLWSMYIDIEEAVGSLDSTKKVYEQAFKYKIVTVQMVLNYAVFLQEHNYWEESFRAYEKGLSLFKYPHVKDIWQAYLTKFVERHKGNFIERTRDLFEQAIQEAPPEYCKDIFLAFAQYEEDSGSYKRAMSVYEKSVTKIPQNERLEVYKIYIQKARKFYQIAKVREVYEMAIEADNEGSLLDTDCKVLCLEFADLERRLGQIDRARTIFVYASSMANPNQDRTFWFTWEDFEIRHGNEETYREMLRLKRSVGASFSSVHYNTSTVEGPDQKATGTVEAGAKNLGDKRQRETDEYQQLLQQRQKQDNSTQGILSQGLEGFVSSGGLKKSEEDKQTEKMEEQGNPDEINLDMDNENEQ